MRRAAPVLAGAAVLVGIAIATATVSESATVVLAIHAKRVQADLRLTGSVGAGDLPTQKLTVQVSDTLAGSTSPVTLTTYSVGEVVFTYHLCVNYPCVRVPAGADVSTAMGVHYTTLADTGVFSTSSRPVPIQAVEPGPSGNTAPGTVVKLGSVPSNMGVTNPSAITGGTRRDTHVITQADFSMVEQALLDEVIADSTRAVRAKAKGMGYGIPGTPDFVEKSSDGVGTETDSFTITLTMTVDVYTFSDSKVRLLLARAVTREVHADQQLTRDSIETDYNIDSLTPDGALTLSGTGVGFVIPKISTQTLQWHLAGLNVAGAHNVLMRAAPEASIRIETWPGGLSYMPVVPYNIAIDVEVLPARE